MKFINVFPVAYYRINVSPEMVREAFPSAFEFKNPTPGSFSAIQPPGKNAGIVVIDVKDENRYVFVFPAEEKLVLINDTLPRVFVVPKKGLEGFFKALAENDLERLTNKGSGRKGKKWRFILDAVAALIVVALSDYFHLGLWGAILVGLIISTVEYLFGPRRKSRIPINELDEKFVKKMYHSSEKKGMVEKVHL